MAEQMPSSSDHDGVVQYNSDAIADELTRLNLSYIALVPGSSFRGLHDSLVNHTGNKSPPRMLLCLHEEHAVALAHGYAKVSSRPMAVALHANVGLMHATMAIYNAFCDRVPMLILGGTGPLDAAKRRPWIDWVHTAADPGALVRNFVKFDDQPHSLDSALESIRMATVLSSAGPCAPAFVSLDTELQESRVSAKPAGAAGNLILQNATLACTRRYLQAPRFGAAAEDVDTVKRLVMASERPLFLLGRVNRSLESWEDRVALAERCDARVVTDIKQAAAFPTAHILHACPPGVFPSQELCDRLQMADLVVSFDWVDLAGTLKAAFGRAGPHPAVVHISLDSALHNGWSKDHFGQPPVDHAVAADPDKFIAALLAQLTTTRRRSKWEGVRLTANTVDAESSRSVHADDDDDDDTITMSRLAEALYTASSPDDMCLIRLPLGWGGADLQSTHPLSYLGSDGGAGLGSGPGLAVGSALALKEAGSELLPVAILGDGDFLMASSALWTAVKDQIPLLVIVANNGSFYNDEVHQERVARARGRTVENKGVGVRIDDPFPDISKNAASFGAVTLDGAQVRGASKLVESLIRAVREVREKRTVVVLDVAVRPDDYDKALNKAK